MQPISDIAALEALYGTLAMPNWRGNNRLGSLRNIVCDGRISLLFIVPGSNNSNLPNS